MFNSFDKPSGDDKKRMIDYMDKIGYKFDKEYDGDYYQWDDDKGGSGRSYDIFMIFKEK